MEHYRQWRKTLELKMDECRQRFINLRHEHDKCRQNEGNTMNSGTTIIISAWDAVNFIDECLDSIHAETQFSWNRHVQVLLAVDGCKPTLNRINRMPRYLNMEKFWSRKNVGNYTIYNSLIDYAAYDYIVIFGADDVMLPGFMEYTLRMRDNVDIVGHCYHVLHHETQTVRVPKIIKPAAGAIGVWRHVFDKCGRFMPWRCAGDTEFWNRARRNEFIFGHEPEVVFLRRSHHLSVTQAEKTGRHSDTREQNRKLIEEMSINDVRKIETIKTKLERIR